MGADIVRLFSEPRDLILRAASEIEQGTCKANLLDIIGLVPDWKIDAYMTTSIDLKGKEEQVPEYRIWSAWRKFDPIDPPSFVGSKEEAIAWLRDEWCDDAREQAGRL